MPTLVALADGRRQFKVDHDAEDLAALLNTSRAALVQLTLSARSGGAPGVIWLNPAHVAFIVDARENL